MSTIEIQEVMSNNDFTVELSSVNNLPNNPSRAQIEDVITDNGFTTPLGRDVAFFINSANNKYFWVTYSFNLDEYYFERLSKAG